MDKEKIIEALHTIQNVCKGMEDCEGCPLRYDASRCTFEVQAPMEWDIITPSGWRAFEQKGEQNESNTNNLPCSFNLCVRVRLLDRILRKEYNEKEIPKHEVSQRRTS